MLGAIIGDMVGSIYEENDGKTKEFNIYNHRMVMTDDSYLTIAVAKTLMKNYRIKYDEKSIEKIKDDLGKEFVKMWNYHRDVGYGASKE